MAYIDPYESPLYNTEHMFYVNSKTTQQTQAYIYGHTELYSPVDMWEIPEDRVSQRNSFPYGQGCIFVVRQCTLFGLGLVSACLARITLGFPELLHALI